jgi:eukaryotic-like serine/threonine-protein kinase
LPGERAGTKDLAIMSTFFGGERYEFVRALGAGGMGCVYLVRDPVLSREVALKVMDERLAGSEEFVERFRREAKAAASLLHPNIVAVYDYGENEQGAPYIAMEHVPGGTLEDTIREKGKLPPRVAAAVALQIAGALEAAHERGIVHRDVKPENVLVSEEGHVKVADFGIAKAAEATAVTATSAVLGSVRYLSPEQARGGEVGPESDLYSLGVVLYEMLTGEVPFRAENPIATAMRHLTEAPAHPSEFEPRIPTLLETVTLKLLAKDPADRYTSARALAEDLERVLAGAAPTEGIRGAGQLSERSPRRRRRRTLSALATIPAVAVLVALASGIGLGEESPLVRLVGGRAQEPLLRVEVPATAAGKQERAAFAAPEPGQADAPTEDGGHKKPPPAEEKSSEPQQLAVQAVANRGTAPPAPRSVQRQAPETTAVPDLTGMSAAEAEAALAEVGLILRIDSYVSREDVPEGIVLYQDAPPGYDAYPGATVAVTVNSGPPPALQEPEKVKPAKENGAAPGDREAKRKPAREKASAAERRRARGRDDRPAAREERRPQEHRPAAEKRPHKDGERHASLGKGKAHRGRGGHEGKENRGDRRGR